MSPFFAFVLVFLCLAAAPLLAATPAPAPSPLPTAAGTEIKPAAENAATSKDEPYMVSGVKVDVSAENSMKARDKAFTEGQRAAFEELVKRMVTDGHFKPFSVSDASLGRLIKSFEIESERASGTRYIATMTFHFRPQETASLFERRNVAFSEDPYARTRDIGMPGEAPQHQGPRFLILPVLRTAARNILWEEQTIWAKAWENVMSDYPAPDFIVSEGTPEDADSVSAADAVAGMPEPLMRAMRLHQAQGVVVAALMSPTTSPASYQNLSIQLARFDQAGRMLGTFVVPLTAMPDISSIVWLQNGAGASIVQLRNIAHMQAAGPGGPKPALIVTTEPPPPGQLPANNIYASGANTHLTATVPFNNMSEWSAMRDAIQQIPGLIQVETLRMNRNRAIVLLGFTGAHAQLADVLKTKGLQLGNTIQPDGTLLLQAMPAGTVPAASMAAPAQVQTVYPSTPPLPQEIESEPLTE